MSAAVAVQHRSLFENIATSPMPAADVSPHGRATMRIWREISIPHVEPQRAAMIECADEECERWDGLA